MLHFKIRGEWFKTCFGLCNINLYLYIYIYIDIYCNYALWHLWHFKVFSESVKKKQMSMWGAVSFDTWQIYNICDLLVSRHYSAVWMHKLHSEKNNMRKNCCTRRSSILCFFFFFTFWWQWIVLPQSCICFYQYSQIIYAYRI